MSKFELAVPHHIKPGKSVKLKDLSTGPSNKVDFGKKAALKRIAANAVEMAEMAKRLYAEDKRSILLVLQGMDTAGKDGTIRSVMRGMNPTSCQVSSFKPRLSLALPQGGSPTRQHRHFQPITLRGGTGRPRPQP